MHFRFVLILFLAGIFQCQLEANGTLDPAFGGRGMIETPTGLGEFDGVKLSVASNNEIILVTSRNRDAHGNELSHFSATGQLLKGPLVLDRKGFSRDVETVSVSEIIAHGKKNYLFGYIGYSLVVNQEN